MTIKQLSQFTRLTLTVSLVLLLYGYLCRLIGIYFFWESKSLGWAILLVGLIGLISDRLSIKDSENKNTLPEKIVIGLLVFILCIQCILVVIIPFSTAYESAKAHIKNNETLKNEVGEIQGFGLIPTGGIEKSTDSSGEYGSAEINLTVKGEKCFKDIVVYVIKTADSPEWKVESFE
jgi:hypothetical protein